VKIVLGPKHVVQRKRRNIVRWTVSDLITVQRVQTPHVTNSTELGTTREASQHLFSHSIVCQHFMDLESSLSYSQELSTSNYPKPDQSCPHNRILSLNFLSYYYPPTYVLFFLVVSFLSVFPLITFTLSSS
jgi:hypothetical protein